jgi:hypothetical protein
MVHGSRTWLDVYTEKLDNALEWSELREKQLESFTLDNNSDSEP